MTQNEWTPDRIALLRKTLYPGAREEEVQLFVDQCKRTELDPFSRQIFMIPRKQKTESGSYETRMTILISIDGLRLIADRTSCYAPGKETVWIFGENGNLLSATAYVKKLTKDGTWHEISATAWLDEFKGAGSFWMTKSKHMLAKCAEALCLRKAFPQETSGLYTDDEIEEVSSSPALDTPKISVEQYERIDSLIGQNTAFREKVMTWLKKEHKINTLRDVPPGTIYDTILDRATKVCIKQAQEQMESKS